MNLVKFNNPFKGFHTCSYKPGSSLLKSNEAFRPEYMPDKLNLNGKTHNDAADFTWQANLCYLEGQWTVPEGEKLNEPFSSARHAIDAKSFFDLQVCYLMIYLLAAKQAVETSMQLTDCLDIYMTVHVYPLLLGIIYKNSSFYLQEH